MSSGPGRFPWGFLLWLAVAGTMILIADPPPPVPLVTDDEAAVYERGARAAVEDALTWEDTRGDRRIGWDQARGHLAIVVDDVGRELRVFEQLLGLRYPLTFSVVPGGVYGPGVVLRARADPRRYREVWLHLPMEPVDSRRMSEGAEAAETFLLSTDDAQTLREKTRAALAAVPVAVGVNNHMGSRLTADGRAMDVVMEELSGAGVMFLDSRTTDQTVALQVARSRGIPAAARQVFLDADPRPAAMEAALAAAVEAARHGPTVAIIHPSDAAVRILRRGLLRAHREGVGVFPLSRVVSHLHASRGAVEHQGPLDGSPSSPPPENSDSRPKGLP